MNLPSCAQVTLGGITVSHCAATLAGIHQPGAVALCPTLKIHTRFNQTMKRLIRPFSHDALRSLLYRIEVHVIHVRVEISLVTHLMFPAASLPNYSFTSPHAHGGKLLRARYVSCNESLPVSERISRSRKFAMPHNCSYLLPR